MEQYFVEGLFLPRRSVRKSKRLGMMAQSEVELFNKSFWANSTEEAILMATEALDGGQWVKELKVSKISEEQRMRTLGAPELPGFNTLKKKRKTGKSQDH